MPPRCINQPVSMLWDTAPGGLATLDVPKLVFLAVRAEVGPLICVGKVVGQTFVMTN